MPTVESTMELKFKQPIQTLDLCVTDLKIPEKPRSLLFPKERVMRFSDLIGSIRYAEIKDRAQRVYDLMEEHGCYCPMITAVTDIAHAIYLRWSEDSRFVIVMVIPEIPFAFARGTGNDPQPCHALGNDDDLWPMLPAFARFVSPTQPRESDESTRRRDRGR